MQLARRERVPETGGEWAELRSPGSRWILELNWYPEGSEFFRGPYRNGDELDHIAFECEDVQRAYRELLARGATAGLAPFVEGGILPPSSRIRTEFGLNSPVRWRLARIREVGLLAGGPLQKDPCIDHPVSVPFFQRQHGVQVQLLNRVEVGHNGPQSQDRFLECGHIAWRFTAGGSYDQIRPDRLDHSPRVAVRQRRQAERDVLEIFDVDSAEAEDQERAVHLVPRHPEDDLHASAHELLQEEALDRDAT